MDELYAPMLADLCETIFGHNANGAPELLSYAHAFVACGPFGPEKGENYTEFGFRLLLKKWKLQWEADGRSQQEINRLEKEWKHKLGEWWRFLDHLKWQLTEEKTGP